MGSGSLPFSAFPAVACVSDKSREKEEIKALAKHVLLRPGPAERKVDARVRRGAGVHELCGDAEVEAVERIVLEVKHLQNTRQTCEGRSGRRNTRVGAGRAEC